MNVLFDHPDPFLFAHGGFQIQIEQTKAALEVNGVAVDYLRWWDDRQKPDIIHYFGRPSPAYIRFAHARKIRVVVAQLLTGAGSRSPATLALQRTATAGLRAVAPAMITERFGWDSFRLADACVALTAWEAKLMRELFGAPPDRVRVIPNGVEAAFLESAPATRGQWLVCTATITERKRVLELARAAIAARTPVWILGKPYAEDDPYAREFLALAAANSQIIRYEGAVDARPRLAAIYREARGFVLLSTKESLSLSALEAAACECPLLLSELPWARTVFGTNAWYCPITGSVSKTADVLKRFYDAAPGLKPPPKPPAWPEIGRQFKDLYESLPSVSR
jgi:glycosyltransferase involved in cell wall biosynthesis